MSQPFTDQKMQTLFAKLVYQIKNGCKKQICFNKFCCKNVFGKEEHEFKDDAEIMAYAAKVLQQETDTESLICSDATTIDRKSLKTASVE